MDGFATDRISDKLGGGIFAMMLGWGKAGWMIAIVDGEWAKTSD